MLFLRCRPASRSPERHGQEGENRREIKDQRRRSQNQRGLLVFRIRELPRGHAEEDVNDSREHEGNELHAARGLWRPKNGEQQPAEAIDSPEVAECDGEFARHVPIQYWSEYSLMKVGVDVRRGTL